MAKNNKKIRFIILDFISDYFKKTSGNIGGGNSTDTGDGDYKPVIFSDSADVTFGALIVTVNHLYTVATHKPLLITAQVFQTVVATRCDKHKDIHLIIRDDQRYPGVLILTAIDKSSVAKLLLQLSGTTEGRTEKHE